MILTHLYYMLRPHTHTHTHTHTHQDVDDDWKVITLWIGGNDLCDICDGDVSEEINI